jgi:hypothetical protein
MILDMAVLVLLSRRLGSDLTGHIYEMSVARRRECAAIMMQKVYRARVPRLIRICSKRYMHRRWTYAPDYNFFAEECIMEFFFKCFALEPWRIFQRKAFFRGRDEDDLHPYAEGPVGTFEDLHLNDWMFEADPRVGAHNSSALAHWEDTPEELAMVLPQRERPPVFVPPRKRFRAAVKIQRRFRWRVAKLSPAVRASLRLQPGRV